VTTYSIFIFLFFFTLYICIVNCIQANGIKIGPQHSPTSPGGLAGTGGQGNAQGGGCC